MSTTLLNQFKEFVKNKPHDEQYDSNSVFECAVAQFAKTVDPSFVHASYSYWVGDKVVRIISEDNPKRAEFFNIVDKQYTFGELARQLENFHE